MSTSRLPISSPTLSTIDSSARLRSLRHGGRCLISRYGALCVRALRVVSAGLLLVAAGADAQTRHPLDSMPVRSVADDPFFPIDRRDWPVPSRVRGPDGSPG